MKSSQVDRIKFGSPISGSGQIIAKQTVSFNLSGSMRDNRRTTKNISVPQVGGFFADAQYRISGSLNQDTRPWQMAPRSAYLMSESARPVPRIYLYMKTTKTNVEITLLETTLSGGNVSISGNYTITVEVWIYSAPV